MKLRNKTNYKKYGRKMNFLKSFKIRAILTLLIKLAIFESNIISPSFSNEIIDNNIKIKEYIQKNSKKDFYILGTGDTLILKINDETTDINKSLFVDGEGFADFNRLGKLYVKGLTLNELTQLLNEKYSKFLLEPNIKLRVAKYRPIRLFISGEVEEPGVHILPGAFLISEKVINGLREETAEDVTAKFNQSQYYSTSPQQKEIAVSNKNNPTDINNALIDNTYFPSVFDALKKAGGITSKANLNKVKITRKNTISNGGGRIGTTVNLFDIMDFKDLDQNVRVMDGDTITVSKSDLPITEQLSRVLKTNLNPKFIYVFVGGQVEKPGTIKISRNAVLNDAINISGGTKIFKGPVRFFRYSQMGILEKRKFRIKRNAKPGMPKNPYLKNGDIIFVGKSSLNIANEVISEITKPFSGIVSSYGLYKALTN